MATEIRPAPVIRSELTTLLSQGGLGKGGKTARERTDSTTLLLSIQTNHNSLYGENGQIFVKYSVYCERWDRQHG